MTTPPSVQDAVAQVRGMIDSNNNNEEHTNNNDLPIPQQHQDPTFDDMQKLTIRNLFEKFKKMNEKYKRPVLRISWDQPTRNSDEETLSKKDFEQIRWTSKLGGYPFWPSDESKYPYKRHSDDIDDENNFGDLQLLAQFNLSEIFVSNVSNLEETLAKLQLPTDGGILQFFIHPGPGLGLFNGAFGGNVQSPQSFRIRYWPKKVVDETLGHKLLDVSKFPKIAATQAEFGKNFETNHFPFYNGESLKIKYKPELEEQWWGWNDHHVKDKFEEVIRQEAPEIVSHLCQPDPEKDRWKIVYALSLMQEETTNNYSTPDPACGSKLGGHPTFTQEDPRRYWKPDEQNLVFQLDSENDVCIGDCGVMGFFGSGGNNTIINNNFFDGVKYNWDCS